MDSIFITSPLTTTFPSNFPPPHRTLKFRKFTTKPHTKFLILSSKTPKKPCQFFPLAPNLFKFSSTEASAAWQCCIGEEKSVPEASGTSREKTESVISVTKTIVYAVFCIAVSFSPVTAFKVPAVALPVATEAILNKIRGGKEKKKESEIVLKAKNHEYSVYTRGLLETVSSLLRSVEEARIGNADVESVKSALKAVKVRKEELQNEIMSGMYKELREMKREKEELVKRGEGIVDEVLKVQAESEKVTGEAKAEMLERIERMEKEYGEMWERVGEIEDGILRRETVALSVGVRELCFIERGCEELVERFSRDMMKKNAER